jgi:hypothetical protein
MAMAIVIGKVVVKMIISQGSWWDDKEEYNVYR